MKKKQKICIFLSMIALILIYFLYCQQTREGLKNKKAKKKTASTTGSEINLGTNWQIKAILPDKDSTKKALENGESKPPDNLAILSRASTQKPWKEILIIKPDGNLIAMGKEINM